MGRKVTWKQQNKQHWPGHIAKLERVQQVLHHELGFSLVRVAHKAPKAVGSWILFSPEGRAIWRMKFEGDTADPPPEAEMTSFLRSRGYLEE